MPHTIIMPKLGQTVEESTIVKWHKQVGDPVAKGDVLFEIETDKAVLEVESFFDGTLLAIVVKEGETVPVTGLSHLLESRVKRFLLSRRQPQNQNRRRLLRLRRRAPQRLRQLLPPKR